MQMRLANEGAQSWRATQTAQACSWKVHT
jgi:hypothetical protein